MQVTAAVTHPEFSGDSHDVIFTNVLNEAQRLNASIELRAGFWKWPEHALASGTPGTFGTAGTNGFLAAYYAEH